jgi:hypothetical protein
MNRQVTVSGDGDHNEPRPHDVPEAQRAEDGGYTGRRTVQRFVKAWRPGQAQRIIHLGAKALAAVRTSPATVERRAYVAHVGPQEPPARPGA